jgi:hypothetical protein
MLTTVLASLALVAATVALHAVGPGALLTFLLPGLAQSPTRFWPSTRLLVGRAWSVS